MVRRDTYQRRAAAWRRASIAVDRMTRAQTAYERENARRWVKVWTSVARRKRKLSKHP
jgi:hypothetical protein